MTAADSHNAPSSSPSRISTVAIAVAALSALLPVLGIGGIHAGLLAPMTGFTLFAAGCLLGGGISLVLGLVAIFLTRDGSDPLGRRQALAATLLAGGLVLLVVAAGSGGADVPPINDITTNLEDPPSFGGDPAGRGRDMSYPAEFKEQVRAAYPDLASMRVNLPPATAFERAEATARELGWEVTRSDPSQGVLEASHATAWFQFVDDVVVRVRSSLVGSEIDIRSKSRDGRGDIGANAARIRAFVGAFEG